METRLLAILLTDLSGYTAFSSKADRTEIEGAVRQQQRIIAPIVDEFHGRLIKWIGDAALATFVSATEAILCAHRIQLSFVENAERGPAVINARVKVVVHAGDIMVDRDGDIYGDAVNFTARLEKASEADEVYFSEAVLKLIPKGEIPYEAIGEFEFKGIAEKARVYRTCFGQSPVVREHVALVQTNFVGTEVLADRHGWDVIHPILDRITGFIVEATRKYGGTSRGTVAVGSFLTFPGVRPALSAAREWTSAINQIDFNIADGDHFKVRTAIHWGTLHIMKYTMMGRDIDIVRTLAALGVGDEVLLTAQGAAMLRSEDADIDRLVPVGVDRLRDCTNLIRWKNKFSDIAVWELTLGNLDLLGKSQSAQ